MGSTKNTITGNQVCEDELEALGSQDAKRLFEVILRKTLKETGQVQTPGLKDFKTKKGFFSNISDTFSKIVNQDKSVGEKDLNAFKDLFLSADTLSSSAPNFRYVFSDYYEDLIEKDLKFNSISLDEAGKLKELLSYKNILIELERLVTRLEIDKLLSTKSEAGEENKIVQLDGYKYIEVDGSVYKIIYDNGKGFMFLSSSLEKNNKIFTYKNGEIDKFGFKPEIFNSVHEIAWLDGCIVVGESDYHPCYLIDTSKDRLHLNEIPDKYYVPIAESMGLHDDDSVKKYLHKKRYITLRKVVGRAHPEDIILDLETNKKIDFNRDTFGHIEYKEIGGETYFYIKENSYGYSDLYNSKEERIINNGRNVSFFSFEGREYVIWKDRGNGKSLYSFEKSSKNKGIIFHNEDDIKIDKKKGTAQKGKGLLGSGLLNEKIKL